MTDRTRAWRRAQRRKHGGHTHNTCPRACWQEKQWRLLYFRSAKLKRAQQLGRFWPYREWERELTEAEPKKVLFVCSKNKWRSPTAEAVFRKDAGLEVRSAGTSRQAKRPISVADIRWADIILVMEDKHRARLRAQFRDEVRYKTMHALDIPDLYRFMDPDLIEIVRDKAEPLIWGD
ncbi:MAG: hypothetical protein AAGL11_11270 [Pseudomonadota bacterium]